MNWAVDPGAGIMGTDQDVWSSEIGAVLKSSSLDMNFGAAGAVNCESWSG